MYRRVHGPVFRHVYAHVYRYDAWCFFICTELDAQGLYMHRKHVGPLAAQYGEAPEAVEAARLYFLKQARKSAWACTCTLVYRHVYKHACMDMCI